MTMNNYEKDPQLGQEIANYLTKLGIDNPIHGPANLEQVSQSIHLLMTGLGLSLNDDSLAKTPQRVARFLTRELFYGLNYNNFPKITFNKNRYGYIEPVISKNISFKSTCEHHLVTISGIAHVVYIPKSQVIGLSKINRVVDFFARRPQVQERATLQIFHALQYILQTEDVAIIISATHHCITMRGVSDQNVENMTYKFGGQLATETLKREILKLIKD